MYFFFNQNLQFISQFKDHLNLSGYSQILFLLLMFPNFKPQENSFEIFIKIFVFLVFNKSNFPNHFINFFYL